MSPETVGLVGTAVLLLLMFLAVPIGICFIMVGFIGFAMIGGGVSTALNMAGMSFTGTVSDYVLATIPVFLLMGEFADISGMMGSAYRSANTWLGNLRGGLAMASILGAAAFSAVSGTSMACAAIMARVALPHLLDHKYAPSLAVGALAAGGTLGNLIPPGILLVFYAILTEVSLGQLFMACLLPGALLVLMYMVQIYIQCRLNPALGPSAGATTAKDKLYATKGMAPVALVFALVMGGIWFGVFTPNEAASCGAVFTFAYAFIRRKLTKQNTFQAFKATLVTTGMAIAIIVGAYMFNIFVAISLMPQSLATWLIGLDLSALGVIIAMMIIYFILGIVMNALPMLLLTLPIFLPLLIAYQIDLIWFGVLAVIQMELANLSPPVGMNLFVVAAIAKPRGISLSTVFRGSLPFCGTIVVFNVLLIAFPQIALYLVSLMNK